MFYLFDLKRFVRFLREAHSLFSRLRREIEQICSLSFRWFCAKRAPYLFMDESQRSMCEPYRLAFFCPSSITMPWVCSSAGVPLML